MYASTSNFFQGSHRSYSLDEFEHRHHFHNDDPAPHARLHHSDSGVLDMRRSQNHDNVKKRRSNSVVGASEIRHEKAAMELSLRRQEAYDRYQEAVEDERRYRERYHLRQKEEEWIRRNVESQFFRQNDFIYDDDDDESSDEDARRYVANSKTTRRYDSSYHRIERPHARIANNEYLVPRMEHREKIDIRSPRNQFHQGEHANYPEKAPQEFHRSKTLSKKMKKEPKYSSGSNTAKVSTPRQSPSQRKSPKSSTSKHKSPKSSQSKRKTYKQKSSQNGKYPIRNIPSLPNIRKNSADDRFVERHLPGMEDYENVETHEEVRKRRMRYMFKSAAMVVRATKILSSVTGE